MKILTELLERDGGRIVAAYALLLTGMIWATIHGIKAEDIIVAGLTLYCRELMGTQTKP